MTINCLKKNCPYQKLGFGISLTVYSKNTVLVSDCSKHERPICMKYGLLHATEKHKDTKFGEDMSFDEVFDYKY